MLHLNYKKTSILFAAVVTLAGVFTVPHAYADGMYGKKCQPIYGGGENCYSTKIVFTKKVQNPQTKEFVNDLTINDPRYAPHQTVNFTINIENTTKETLSDITIVDTFPAYLNYISGPGSFDNAHRTLTFHIDKLNPNQVSSFNLSGITVLNEQLPADQGIVCVANQAAASNKNFSAQTNAKFCIEKNAENTTTKGGLTVYPPSKAVRTPATGPEALPLLFLLPSAIAGALIRKRTNH